MILILILSAITAIFGVLSLLINDVTDSPTLVQTLLAVAIFTFAVSFDFEEHYVGGCLAKDGCLEAAMIKHTSKTRTEKEE